MGKLDMCTMLWNQYRLAKDIDFVGSIGCDASELRQTNFFMTRWEYCSFKAGMTCEQKLEFDWNRCFVKTSMPMTCSGYGESTFPHKFHTMSHQFHILSGTTPALGKLRNSVVAVMSDQAGTERQLADSPAVDDPAELEVVMQRLAEGATTASNEPGAFYFPRALKPTDPMHMIWNAFEWAIRNAGLYDEYEPGLGGILACLGHNGRRQKWLAQASLTPEERACFHRWPYRIVDWKWQYMYKIFNALAPVVDLYLSKVD